MRCAMNEGYEAKVRREEKQHETLRILERNKKSWGGLSDKQAQEEIDKLNGINAALAQSNKEK